VARHLLEEPASPVTMPERKLGVAKLKGVGVYDPASMGRYRDRILDAFSDEPKPPTTKSLHSFATYPHVGISKDGDFIFAYGGVAPVGGILHDRALREFRMARTLYENGVPTIIPLAVIRYKDLMFEGEPMGAVITLSSEPAPYRLAQVQYLAGTQRGKNKDADAYVDRVYRSLGIEGDYATEVPRLQALQILAKEVGRIIHDFSAAGLYRHSSEWSNFDYCFEHKEILLTDLDSVRDLSELSGDLRALQVLRDVGTLVYRFISKFSTPTALGQYTITNLLKYDPLKELLLGYFPDADPAALFAVVRKLWGAYIPHLCLLLKHKDAIVGEWDNDRRKTYKMDHDLFYIMSMILLFPFFRDSDLARLYPSDLTLEGLQEKARSFLGARYEYLQFLMLDQPSAENANQETYDLVARS